MVSKLKQQMRRARQPAALAQPDIKQGGAVQWLELQGQLKLKLGNLLNLILKTRKTTKHPQLLSLLRLLVFYFVPVYYIVFSNKFLYTL
jgi:hypothetical protein